MNTFRWAVCGTAAVLGIAGLGVGLAYHRDISAARLRVSSGSGIVQTQCGPIEYAVRGEGPALLVIHGAGGGFDQALMIAEALHGFRVIAPSRFGYLRTPVPREASAEAQADAYACLLDSLQVQRVAVLGVSAGGPSSMQFCLRHAQRCAAMVLLVPLAWSDQPAATKPRSSPLQQFVMERTLQSDFVFWAVTHMFRGAMVEAILGTPLADVASASPEDQQRTYAMLDLIQPISQRRRGLQNERLVAQSLRRFELEKIAAPTLIASVEDCGYGTYGPARYTAEHIPGARFIGYPKGGHLWLGHTAELYAEVQQFLAGNVIASRAR